MKLSENEKRIIKAKLTAAKDLADEAYNLIRTKDDCGESDLAVHVDSVRNDLDDTIDIVKTV
jgi:hypothetical protein